MFLSLAPFSRKDVAVVGLLAKQWAEANVGDFPTFHHHPSEQLCTHPLIPSAGLGLCHCQQSQRRSAESALTNFRLLLSLHFSSLLCQT